MSSKQLSSILKSAPAATVSGQQRLVEGERNQNFTNNTHTEEQARIVAVIPISLKEEIKHYIKANKGMTERVVLLKALKQMGFNIKDHWLVDNRSTR